MRCSEVKNETADETDFSALQPLASHGVQDPGPPTYSGSYQPADDDRYGLQKPGPAGVSVLPDGDFFACCDEVPPFHGANPWGGPPEPPGSFPGRQRDRWARALSRAYEDAGDAQAKHRYAQGALISPSPFLRAAGGQSIEEFSNFESSYFISGAYIFPGGCLRH
jgi:hypothetical protein